jgi:serine phosphatase RsbU (regulator of sigma subunit)
LEQVLVHERLADEVFATACMVSVAPDRRSATVRVAGHPLPVLIAGGEATELPGPPSRPPLGIGAGAGSWPEVAVTLPAGWQLLMYTDGLIEGRVPDRGAADRLGTQRLVELVRERAGAESGSALINRLIGTAERLNGGDLTDDVAVLVLAAP